MSRGYKIYWGLQPLHPTHLVTCIRIHWNLQDKSLCLLSYGLSRAQIIVLPNELQSGSILGASDIYTCVYLHWTQWTAIFSYTLSKMTYSKLTTRNKVELKEDCNNSMISSRRIRIKNSFLVCLKNKNWETNRSFTFFQWIDLFYLVI